MASILLSWDWFDQSVRAMSQRYRARFADQHVPTDGIIALGRGGMTVGTRLSYLLNVPLAGVVLMSRFKNPTAEITEPPIDGIAIAPYVLSRRGPLLLVDNIVSEGVTMQLARDALSHAGVDAGRIVPCVLLAREGHAPDGIIGAHVNDPDAWYVFPWELRT